MRFILLLLGWFGLGILGLRPWAYIPGVGGFLRVGSVPTCVRCTCFAIKYPGCDFLLRDRVDASTCIESAFDV